jgi:hypothetical protein
LGSSEKDAEDVKKQAFFKVRFKYYWLLIRYFVS